MEHPTLSLLLANLRRAVGYQGDYAHANTCFEEGVQHARQMKSLGYLSVVWGDIHLYFQQLDAATRIYQEVLDLVDTRRSLLALAMGWPWWRPGKALLARARDLGQQSLVDYEAMNHYKTPEVRQWLLHLDDETPSLLPGDDTQERKLGGQEPEIV